MNGWTKTVGATLILGTVVIGTAGTASADPGTKQRPNVTVSIENDRNALPMGSEVEYTITVRNDDDQAYADALIAQMLPKGLTYSQVSPEAKKSRPEEVVWIHELPAHGEVTMHLTGTVGELAEGRTDLTTTVCVLPDGKTRPAFCDSDSDPVGQDGASWIPLVLVLVLAAAAGIGGWLWFFKKRPGTPVKQEPETVSVS